MSKSDVIKTPKEITWTELVPIRTANEINAGKLAKFTPEEEKHISDEYLQFTQAMTSPFEKIRHLLAQKQKVTFYRTFHLKNRAEEEKKIISNYFPGAFEIYISCNCAQMWDSNHRLSFCSSSYEYGYCNCKCPFNGCVDECDIITLYLKPKKRKFLDFSFRYHVQY
jgi:hypothetical protein